MPFWETAPTPRDITSVNFLLHAINVWLLYELALAMFRRASPAFFAAALWAVHPIGTEAVTSIVGRADLLAAMSVLGGLLLYIRHRNRWAPAALFAIACAGVFAKENAAVLLGLMLLWDLSFGEGTAGATGRWRSYAAVAASLVILAVVRHAVLGGLPPDEPVYVDNPLRGADFWTARWTAIGLVGLDLRLVLFPLTLSCDRSFDTIRLATFADPWAWLSLLVSIAILRNSVAAVSAGPPGVLGGGLFRNRAAAYLQLDLSHRRDHRGTISLSAIGGVRGPGRGIGLSPDEPAVCQSGADSAAGAVHGPHPGAQSGMERRCVAGFGRPSGRAAPVSACTT